MFMHRKGNKCVFMLFKLFLSRAGGQEEVEDTGTQADVSKDREQLKTGQRTC